MSGPIEQIISQKLADILDESCDMGFLAYRGYTPLPLMQSTVNFHCTNLMDIKIFKNLMLTKVIVCLCFLQKTLPLTS